MRHRNQQSLELRPLYSRRSTDPKPAHLRRSRRWFSYNPLKETLPSAPGCYVAYLDGELVYVGQSKNVAQRFACYPIRDGNRFGYNNLVLTPWGRARKVVIKVRRSFRYGDWAMLELRLIKRLQPKANCVGSQRKQGSIAGEVLGEPSTEEQCFYPLFDGF